MPDSAPTTRPPTTGPLKGRPAGSASDITLRAAHMLAQRYETGQHEAIEAALRMHPATPEYDATLTKISVDLFGLARRELSVRLAAEDSLMTQDVSVLLARVAVAAYPFARLFTRQGALPRNHAWETLVAVTTVAYAHENASTPGGARKLRDEINYVWEMLFEEGSRP